MKTALAIILLSSFVMAFSVLHRIDGDVVMGSDYVFRVTETAGQPSSDQVAREISTFAAKSRINIARFVPDLHDTHRRYLYLASGAPGSASTY